MPATIEQTIDRYLDLLRNISELFDCHAMQGRRVGVSACRRSGGQRVSGSAGRRTRCLPVAHDVVRKLGNAVPCGELGSRRASLDEARTGSGSWCPDLLPDV
jgi:hypothetical protein